MARAAEVRVRGLRELDRSLGKVNKEAQKTVRLALMEAARPVVETAKRKEIWAGASLSTIGAKASAMGVFVTQRARKVTGLRPDYGRLQQLEAFNPALEENTDKVYAEVELALDLLLRESGL